MHGPNMDVPVPFNRTISCKLQNTVDTDEYAAICGHAIAFGGGSLLLQFQNGT